MKETYVGGDIIETTGGSNLSYAKNSIENNGSQVVQNGVQNGVIYGKNGEIPIIGNQDVNFYVEIYRSKTQIADNFGQKDPEYKGTFGFDRYNETTSGKGKQSIDNFEIISLNGNKYYVPWLSLWPPKQNLKSISEIDTSYNPIINAKLILKVLPGKTSKGNAKMFITSDNSNIRIDTNTSITKEVSINDIIEITVSCEGVLEKDAKIEIKQNDEHGVVVGKLKIIKNNIIYIANTKFITVMEEEKATNNTNKQQKREAEKIQFQNLIKDVIVYLNTKSLNQSLIYVKGSVEDVFVIDKGEINRTNEGTYSRSIITPYFEGKSEDKSKDDSAITTEEKELDKAIRELYNALEKNYRKNRKNTYFCEETVNQTNTQLFINYEEKYQAYLNSIGKKIGGHNLEPRTLYVFVDKGLETLSVGGMKYYGYTFGADKSAFIFNQHVKERKFGTFAHEIAHSLGLDHTFELNEKDYRPNKSLNERIEQKEKILKEKNKTKQSQRATLNILEIQNKFIQFVADERDLDKLINYKDNVISTKGKKEYYKMIDDRISFIKDSGRQEKESQNTSLNNSDQVDISTNISEDINNLKAEKEQNKNKYIDVLISETQENFMDYDYDSNNSPNSNFEPKSFFKWQWDNLMLSKFLNKKNI